MGSKPHYVRIAASVFVGAVIFIFIVSGCFILWEWIMETNK